VSPRELRSAMKHGEWTSVMSNGNLPLPPSDWPRWKRERMSVAIRCGALFIFQAKKVSEITQIIGGEKLFDKRRPTKQRVAQYVKKGLDFMMDRGVFVAVGGKQE
jgi:hypothetical protein